MMKTKSILIADKDMYYRTLIAASLQMVTGISDILKAACLDVTVGVMKRHRPDIVFLDYDLLQDCSQSHLDVFASKNFHGTLVLLTDGNGDEHIDNRAGIMPDVVIPKNKLLQPFNFTADAILLFLAERLKLVGTARARL
jgi:DNA-binding NarL/FixJ family response regulator